MGTPLLPAQAHKAKEIDRIRTQCMLKAEKKCRKLFKGAVAFSKETDEPRKQIDFWMCTMRCRKGSKVSSRLWRRKKKAAKVTQPIRSMTLPEMDMQLKQAKADYRVAKKNHIESRISYLEAFPTKDKERMLKREEQ